MAKNIPLIVFQVAELTFGVPAEIVQQMEMIEQVTRVPNAPNFVDGVVYLRGQVIPVINLRRRFGMKPIPYDLHSRLIVVNLAGRLVGLAVDSAREYLAVSEDQILPPPAQLGDESLTIIQGMISQPNRLIIILDVSQVLSAAAHEPLNLTV